MRFLRNLSFGMGIFLLTGYFSGFKLNSTVSAVEILVYLNIKEFEIKNSFEVKKFHEHQKKIRHQKFQIPDQPPLLLKLSFKNPKNLIKKELFKEVQN